MPIYILKKSNSTHWKRGVYFNQSSNTCPFYCATERISALTLYSVFSSLLLPLTANFLDTRWEPPSLQTPVACLSAYPVPLSHLEFPMKKQQQTKALLSIQQCYSKIVTTQKRSSGNALCLASYRSTSTCPTPWLPCVRAPWCTGTSCEGTLATTEEVLVPSCCAFT